MAFLKVENIKLEGLAACVPQNIERTKDYAHISKEEQKIFTFGTGIEERRVAPKHICTSDMCYAAAKQLFKDTNTRPEEIDVLLFVSQSPDYFLPATSIILQERLGCSKQTMAFDINLGCSGYVYGLSVLSNLMNMPHFRKGLLLCGDKSSFSPSYTDKSTYPLFGDAGTATIISKDEKASPMFFNLQSDGKGWESIIIRGGGTRFPYSAETTKKKQVAPGIERADCNLELDGMEVFNFSLREVKPNVLKLLEFADVDINNVDYFVMHQANKLMNESVRKKMKIPIEKVPYSIHKFGNTSSASIPMTMVTGIKDELSSKKNKVLLSGFGVGYSWGTALLDIENLVISELIEIE
ncbi:MAG: ketoacyl-ACP synthase III [Flavobacteriales bacterium]|nr:ketoacyl-ACP synthase III [Flavobacteriales bacterium]NQX97813.1 ketoacyl-ACP synthase III [Flavobacteriales bacterium]